MGNWELIPFLFIFLKVYIRWGECFLFIVKIIKYERKQTIKLKHANKTELGKDKTSVNWQEKDVLIQKQQTSKLELGGLVRPGWPTGWSD